MLKVEINSGRALGSYTRSRRTFHVIDIVRNALGSVTGYRVLIKSATESFVR